MTRFDKALLLICGLLFVVALAANGAVVQDGKNYVGLSSDPTPTTATVGSRFYETDTRKAYLVVSAGTRSLLYASPTGSEPITAITSAPAYTGQMSIVSGAAYLATGTTNTANWKKATSEVYYTQDTPNTSVTGTTSETMLWSKTIPGGTMTANSTLELIFITTQTNNANNKFIQIYLGSQAIYTGSGYNILNMAATRGYPQIINAGAVNSQIFPNASLGFGNIGTVGTGAVDMSVDQTLSVKATLGNATDTLTLKYVGINVNRAY